jgi:hypothetical protein
VPENLRELLTVVEMPNCERKIGKRTSRNYITNNFYLSGQLIGRFIVLDAGF